MKVKEVDITANIAWSPSAQVPIYLAAGTAAQQLDASFSTNSNLEIYGLNLSESGHDMPRVASLPVDQRYHKLVWGATGVSDGSSPSGLIVGGADRGVISIYDAAKLIKGDNALVFSKEKHTGPVAALDFNPFQSNLLASGGSESELYIWDINKPTSPMTPGAKSQPLDDVRCVSWNRQVQHILASTFASRCVVWDLRKNDPIIKVSDSTSRMRCKVVSWHPEVATQLCLASEDDHTPVIQIWDLRLASSPLRTLEGHHKGVLSLAWCQADPDLLISCGKDNRLLVWNPNSASGEIVAELPTSNQWSFDVSWCPRNPGVIASASFDGRVSVYSLMGGQQQVQPNTNLTDSFGPAGIQDIPGRPVSQPKVTCQLKSPPKWLRTPCGASFGFGGKLVTCENVSGEKPKINISRVVTETQLVESSAKLETSLSEGNLQEFCQVKLASEGEGDKAKIWQFIGASFAESCDQEYLNLLGVELTELSAQLRAMLQPQKPAGQGDESALAGDMKGLDLGAGDEFDIIAKQAVPEEPARETSLDKMFKLERDNSSASGQLTVALLAGDIELAVDTAIKQNRFAEALILSIRGGQELWTRTQARYFQEAAGREENSDGLALVEAVALNGWEKLVSNCDLSSWREVLAAVLTYTDTSSKHVLAGRLGDRLADGKEREKLVSALQCYLVAGQLDKIVSSWLQLTAGGELSPAALQELVELAMVCRASVTRRGLTSSSAPGGQLSSALGQYASLLASQGSLTTAMSYLPEETVAGDKELTQLKERLQRALTAPGPVQHQRTGRGSQPAARNVSGGRHSFSQPAPASVRRPSMEPNYGNFNTGFPGQPSPSYSNSHMMTPAVSAYQPTPSPSQPPPAEPVPTLQPPPPSSESSAPVANPLLRRGRAVDPSIAPGGGGGYGQYGQYGQPQPLSDPYNTGYQQPSYTEAASQPHFFTPEAGGAVSSMAPPPTGHVPDQPGPGFTPMVSNGSGWNDPPPMMIRKTTPSQGTTTTPALSSDPITQPLFGGQEPAPAPAQHNTWGGFQPAPTHADTFQPQAPHGYSGFQPSEPAPVSQPPPQAPVTAAPAAPIPAEHQVIQDTLENLRAKCQQGNTGSQYSVSFYVQLSKAKVVTSITTNIHEVFLLQFVIWEFRERKF